MRPKGCAVGDDAVEVERVHIVGVFEDLAELFGEHVEFLSLMVRRASLATCGDVLATQARHYTRTFARNSSVERSTSSWSLSRVATW